MSLNNNWLLQENMVKEEVEIRHRVHSMIIGRRGMGIRKIMSDYKVDIKLPRQGDPNPDLVVVSKIWRNLLVYDTLVIDCFLLWVAQLEAKQLLQVSKVIVKDVHWHHSSNIY